SKLLICGQTHNPLVEGSSPSGPTISPGYTARMNAVEIEAAIAVLAEQPVDAAEFPFTFLEAFGNKVETTIKRLRGKHNKSDVEGGVLQRNNIHLATCEAGQVEATLKA